MAHLRRAACHRVPAVEQVVDKARSGVYHPELAVAAPLALEPSWVAIGWEQVGGGRLVGVDFVEDMRLLWRMDEVGGEPLVQRLVALPAANVDGLQPGGGHHATNRLQLRRETALIKEKAQAALSAQGIPREEMEADREGIQRRKGNGHHRMACHGSLAHRLDSQESTQVEARELWQPPQFR